MTAARLAIGGLVWLGVFSLLFSTGAALRTWPSPPPGALHGVDLLVGIVFGAALLAVELTVRRFGVRYNAAPGGRR